MHSWHRIVFLFFTVSVLTSDPVFAQKIPAQTDSTLIYKNIESYSRRSKYTKLVYPLIFRPASTNLKKTGIKKKTSPKLKPKAYSAYEGKIIRFINIETLDPFGCSIADTNVRKQNYLSKTGNKLHVKSLHITIRNLLLIRQNQVFDSLLVKESERLVRSRSYVTDVSFLVKAVPQSSDSVDIFIRELDNWSIIPKIAASTSSFTFNLPDRNFLGLGHESQNEYTWNHSSDRMAYRINYYIPNIRNTYINSTLHFSAEELGNFTRSYAIDRPFFSPYARWAAGVNFSHQLRRDSIHISGALPVLQQFKFNTQDFWAGHAMQAFKGNTEDQRTTNFIAALRFVRVCYLEKPSDAYNLQHFYANEEFYLASIGISTRKYTQDKYVFKFGVTEDVPVGKVYSLTSGYQRKNNSGRLYLGARISSGSYHSWGYLSFNCEYGAFFHESNAEQGVLAAGVNYFTALVEIGKWKFRQFVKPQLTIGINRFVYDSLTINDGYGLDGFNSLALSGTSRLLLTLQTQSYAPCNWFGFRFGPYFIFSLGKLGDATTGFSNSKLYSQIGLGVLIKNDHLVINTFQLSLAYYPLIPGKGQNIFKINSFRTADFGFRDFEIGKPAIVLFQ